MYCQLKMPDNVNLDVEFVAPDLEEKPCGHQPERQSRQHFQVHRAALQGGLHPQGLPAKGAHIFGIVASKAR